MRKKLLIDLEEVGKTNYEEMLKKYIINNEGKSAEIIAEDIWNDEEISDQDVVMLLMTVGYIVCLNMFGQSGKE